MGARARSTRRRPKSRERIDRLDLKARDIGNHKQFRSEAGIVVNWPQSTRTIYFQGLPVDIELLPTAIFRPARQPVDAELSTPDRAPNAAQAVRSRAGEDKRRQVELALEQARYEVGRARRQYDAVDPDNRLVAAELEKRWNERLAIVRSLETELEGLTASPATELTPADRERLITLGADLQLAWTRPGVTPETRKRIVRTLIAPSDQGWPARGEFKLCKGTLWIIKATDLEGADVKSAATARRPASAVRIR